MQHVIYTDSHEETVMVAKQMIKKLFRKSELIKIIDNDTAIFKVTDPMGERFFKVELFLVAMGIWQFEEHVYRVMMEDGLYKVLETVTTYSRNMEVYRYDYEIIATYKTKRSALNLAKRNAEIFSKGFNNELIIKR